MTSRLQQIMELGRQPLEVEVYEILKDEGVDLLPYHYMISEEMAVQVAGELDAQQKYAIKIMSHKILHKSDFQAVKLNILSREIPGLYSELSERFSRLGFEGILVVPMAEPGIELLVGSTTDPTFGLVSVFGVGGTMVELIRDVTFGKAPLTKQAADIMINDLKTQELLNGPRGLPPVDRVELSNFLIKISEIAYKFQNCIREMDLNPVRITRKGIYPLDARMIFHPETC